MKKRGFGVKNHFLGSFWAIVTTQTIFMPIRLHGRPSHRTSHHIQVKSCFLVSSSNRFWPFLPIFGSFWHWLSPRHNLNPHHLLFPSFHIIPQVFPNKRSNPRHFIFFWDTSLSRLCHAWNHSRLHSLLAVKKGIFYWM